jgi:hypothetical protein
LLLITYIYIYISFSLLELDKYGDENYGSCPTNSTSINLNNHHQLPHESKEEGLQNGKLEKSFMNFQHEYGTLFASKTLASSLLHGQSSVVSPAAEKKAFPERFKCFKEIK